MPRAVLTDEQVLELTKKSLERTIVRRREETFQEIKKRYEKEQRNKQERSAPSSEMRTV